VRTGTLTDREQVERIRQQLTDGHCDATLLVNAAGLFIPKPFLDYDGTTYDSYFELDRAIFFLTQTVVRSMVEQGRGGAIVTITILGGPDDTFARVGPGDPCRRGTRDT
jgi:short-subunit dehydrogenase